MSKNPAAGWLLGAAKVAVLAATTVIVAGKTAQSAKALQGSFKDVWYGVPKR